MSRRRTLIHNGPRNHYRTDAVCGFCGENYGAKFDQKFCRDECRSRWNNWQRRKKKVYVKTSTFAKIVPWKERKEYQLSPYSDDHLRLIDV